MVFGLFKKKPKYTQEQEVEITIVSLLTSMSLVALADGSIAEDEKEAMAQICEQLSGQRPTNEQIGSIIASANGLTRDQWESVLAHARDLPKENRVMVVKASILISASDGDLDDKEVEMIAHIAGLVGLSQSDVDGVVRSMAESARKAGQS